MNRLKYIFVLIILSVYTGSVFTQTDSPEEIDSSFSGFKKSDSIINVIQSKLLKQQQIQQMDSIIKMQLIKELQEAEGDNQRTLELEKKLRDIAIKDSIEDAEQLKNLEKLKKESIGYPVILVNDTLFKVYTKIGPFNAQERAAAIMKKILQLYEDPFFDPDSLETVKTEFGYDIVYNNETVILSVNILDALWFGKDNKELADEYNAIVKNKIEKAKDENSLISILKRIGWVLLIIIIFGVLIIYINKLFRKFRYLLIKNKDKYLKGITIRDIKILTPGYQLIFAKRLLNILRVIVIIIFAYLALPVLFSVFPKTKTYANILIGWILTPARNALISIFEFLPNLFTIVVIYFIFKYTIKAIKYFVDEIQKGNITISGFHSDWAQPTFNILKFLLYAFMLVLIFPYLPGSGSPAFQGISVFIGVLLSFGSSNAISNMVAGLVITYMRPFKIGDRVKIGDVTGDVIEKSMLVTRIRTIKNEDVTVPNANVLSNSTINYTSNTKPEDPGLIVHSTVTIGYDVPWKNMHNALIEAALRTDMILKKPEPFVLQTSLDDFYVSYQINAYTKEPGKQAFIYSQLHQNIQDCCNEAGIEILSPHYRSDRDGNQSTIPAEYLGKDYEAPAFRIKQIRNDDNKKPEN